MVTIKINSSIPKFLLLGIVLGIITVFGIEHFGKFSYLEEARYMPVQNGKPSFTREISMNTPISQIYFKTPFGSNLTFGGNGYKVSDMYFSNQGLHKYSNKVEYYVKATSKDKPNNI